MNSVQCDCADILVFLNAGLFNEAMSVGFTQASEYLELWTAYVDFLKRQIDWHVGRLNCCVFVISRILIIFGLKKKSKCIRKHDS